MTSSSIDRRNGVPGALTPASTGNGPYVLQNAPTINNATENTPTLVTPVISGQPTGNITGTGAVVLATGATTTNQTLHTPVLDSPMVSGTVRMVYYGGAWVVVKPDGTILNTSGSTTSGLQEAINFAMAPRGTAGYDFEIIGGDDASTDTSLVINVSTTVQWPAMQGRKVRMGAVNVNATVDLNPVMQFDSCMMTFFSWEGGQCVNAGSTASHFNIVFKAVNGTPYDGVIGFVDSYFIMGSCGNVQIDLSNPSGFTNCVMHCGENQGGDSRNVGFQVTQGIAGSNFTDNHFILKHIHGFLATGLQVGTGATANSGNVFGGNTWDVSIIQDTSNNQILLDTYAKGDIYSGSIRATIGAVANDIVLRTTAEKNRLFVNRNTGSAVVSDNSTTQDNEGMYGWWKARASVNLSAAQTNVVTATPTKVAFNTALYNTGNSGTSFDITTNHRWSPGRVGYAKISAGVAWATVNDQMQMIVSIYKNGSEILKNRVCASGTQVDQGSQISATVAVTAVGDYFEIFALHDHGSNISIDNVLGTFAQFEMIDG